MVDASVVTEGAERRRLVPVPVIAAVAVLAVITLVIALLFAFGVLGSTDDTAERDLPPEFAAAQAQYDSGDFAGAEAALAEIVNGDPEDLAARRALALALAAQGKNDAAIEQYAAVVEADDQDHESFYRMAVIERLTGKSEAAITHFEAANDLKPQSLYADELARTYMQVGRYTDAVAAWQTLLGSADLDEAAKAAVYAAMADAYSGARDYEKARESLASALELTPNDENLKARLEALGD